MPTPERLLEIPIDFACDEAAYQELRNGLLPEDMEDKWFVYWDDPWICFHRSWTGLFVYKIRFEKNGHERRAVEAFVNADPSEFQASDPAHEAKLLRWIIEAVVLERDVPYPLPPDGDARHGE
jgi:hypothetical protein